MKKKKYISVKETESILFNLDSMRTKLFNDMYEHPENEDKCWERIEEIEGLSSKLTFTGLNNKELERVREIVNERKFQRYVTCLNAGLSEQIAGGAYED